MSYGKIFSIEEFGVHDGPGIRKIVFLKGCPLKCNWCHNPEGISFKTETMVNREGVTTACGQDYKAKELAEELLKGKEILKHSGGGITISGGEPLAQPAFLLELMDRLKPMHLVVETSGHAGEDIFSEVMAKADCIFMDVKHTDRGMHKKHTGQVNDGILKNLETLCKGDTDFVIRVPLIPGVNDSRENLAATAGLIKEAVKLKRVELMPYHKTAGAKYSMVGRDYRPLFDVDRQVRPHAEEFEKYGIETIVL